MRKTLFARKIDNKIASWRPFWGQGSIFGRFWGPGGDPKVATNLRLVLGKGVLGAIW